MQVNDLDSDNMRKKVIFIRKNGKLRAIKVDVEKFNYSKKQHPMFPISRDRNEKSE